MKTYRMSIYLGSTLLMHECFSIYDIVCSMRDLMGMIPGMDKALRGVEINDDVFKQTEVIIGSMTPAEREHPEIINPSRKARIAAGSGTTLQDVNRLLKQFEDMRKVMKMAAGAGNKRMPMRGMPMMPRGRRR